VDRTVSEKGALAIVCEDLPGLREECARSERQAKLLARIEQEATARRPVLSLLAELLGLTPEEALEDYRQAATGFPGMSGGRADNEIFGCPDGACARTDTTVPAGAPPKCLLTGKEMRRLS
jgi:hypothetical protein